MKTEREIEMEILSHPAKAAPQSPTLDNLFRTVRVGLTNYDGMTTTNKAQRAIDATREIEAAHAALQAENAELRECLKEAIDIADWTPNKWIKALTRPPEVK